ncbi:hypothetical protein DBB36_22300 [Flavobacterium sp. WLB]|uniref:XAC2610-related protein n=1 Tax=unclassified Flavobacterium TaxID=196869 RepID=UPI0006AB8117|nr:MULTISPECIES: hypothetical protein [unclassified Flavobacterium]KOP39653.1 hypothetical protein AKO67_03625 [Flavobacterium sp. VMW]OWU90206.1 hypothetical protein APR43_14105 [Flavobacterium sp. NLM]PUU67755.1 hypothetical protein DBB36_22300 [Flavobacterium sp. WLB]
MKNLISIFIILLLMSCRNTAENVSSKKDRKDEVSVKELSQTKIDTSVKVSPPFILNNIKCNWKQIDSVSGAITIELRDYKTQRILLSYSDYFKSGNDVNAEDYFNEHFQDLNFDGFKDFLITSSGSTAMTDLVNIYLFNEKTKSFEFSEELSDNTIDEVDKVNRKLSTTSSTLDDETIKKHYFNKNGTIKYSEIITRSDVSENDSVTHYKNIYEKVVNGQVVKTKEYSTIE